MRLRSVIPSIFFLALCAALQAQSVAPPAPLPLAPAAGASVLSPFTLSWSAVTDPSGIIAYNWQVSPASNFAPVILQNSTSGQTQDIAGGLANGSYFWRVQAVNGNLVQGAWSTARAVTVSGATASAPTMNPPTGYSTFHPLEVLTLTWSAIPGAASYVLQFSQDQTFPVLTRGQFDNIPNPTFSFALADEGNYFARVYAVDAGGVAGPPSNLVPFSVFYSNPLPAPPAPVSPANGVTLSLPVTVQWSAVANPQPSGYELQIARDSGFSTIEEDDPQLNNPARTVLSLSSGTKFWRVRSAQGDSSPTTAALTAWSRSGSFTIASVPPAPVSLAAATNPLFSGDSTWMALQLSAAAPASGATVALTSSNPAALPVPATIAMPGNFAWTQFQLTSGQVSAPTAVTLTATLNSRSASVTINVMPPSLKSFTLSPATIGGGSPLWAIVMLNGQAPLGGAVVSLLSSSPAVITPASVVVQAGSPSVSFPIPTGSVSTATAATITADWNGKSLQTGVTIVPQAQPGLSSLTLGSSTVAGGSGTQATVTLTGPAPAGGTVVALSSDSAAASVAPSVTVQAGTTSAAFAIGTSSVTASTVATITASAGGATRAAGLTVTPLPPAPQSATLTVSATGRSGESVTSTPAGINAAVGSSGSASFTVGTAVTLTISNGRDAVWSGACSSGGNKTKTCTLSLAANAAVTANVQ